MVNKDNEKYDIWRETAKKCQNSCGLCDNNDQTMAFTKFGKFYGLYTPSDRKFKNAILLKSKIKKKIQIFIINKNNNNILNEFLLLKILR